MFNDQQESSSEYNQESYVRPVPGVFKCLCFNEIISLYLFFFNIEISVPGVPGYLSHTCSIIFLLTRNFFLLTLKIEKYLYLTHLPKSARHPLSRKISIFLTFFVTRETKNVNVKKEITTFELGLDDFSDNSTPAIVKSTLIKLKRL
ncbi:hypothetical protein RIR_jg32142.t1 [Rhizophagus irregularis DAOM 181602=DAOM 197198]|nr:hypothetical protein RIR_jg32142.t1 [Rhizophagus irregularis DAOM 181602=DAOM 197198]